MSDCLIVYLTPLLPSDLCLCPIHGKLVLLLCIEPCLSLNSDSSLLDLGFSLPSWRSDLDWIRLLNLGSRTFELLPCEVKLLFQFCLRTFLDFFYTPSSPPPKTLLSWRLLSSCLLGTWPGRTCPEATRLQSAHFLIFVNKSLNWHSELWSRFGSKLCQALFIISSFHLSHQCAPEQGT